MKKVKVKNVIKGFESRFDIESIHIITPNKILFAGDYKKFKDVDKYLEALQSQILESECENCLLHNFRNLYVFIDELI